MKLIKGKSMIALLAALILVVSTVGFTVAYFSDNDDAKGAGGLSLNPQTVIDEGQEKTEKNVVIKNTGNADVLVRAKFFGPAQMVVSPGANWKQGAEGWWYCTKVVKAPNGDTGAAINAKVVLEGTEKEIERQKAELGDAYDITVIQEAAIVTYEGSKIKTPSGWDSSITFKEE